MAATEFVCYDRHLVEQETSSDNDYIKQSMHFGKICFGNSSGKLSMYTCTNAQ